MEYKKLVGKKVHLIPRGNLINRRDGTEFDQATSATISKATSIFVEFTSDSDASRLSSKKLRINKARPEILSLDGLNGGYLVFESEEAINTYIKGGKARKRLMDEIYTISDTDLCKIADALKWEL